MILIFGDHGLRSELNWKNVNGTNHHESMSVLNSFYLPGLDDEGLRPDLNPVNTFRIVFNAYFGQQYELLPVWSYYSTARQPLRFYDLTADVLAGRSGPPMARK